MGRNKIKDSKAAMKRNDWINGLKRKIRWASKDYGFDAMMLIKTTGQTMDEILKSCKEPPYPEIPLGAIIHFDSKYPIPEGFEEVQVKKH